MTKIQFDFDIDGTLSEDPFLDRVELHMMFDQTKHSLAAALERKLGDIQCTEHDQEPTVTITGRYDAGTEQFDMSYHVDTCCKRFMVTVVARLNNVN